MRMTLDLSANTAFIKRMLSSYNYLSYRIIAISPFTVEINFLLGCKISRI
jgi:hypothetical protein